MNTGQIECLAWERNLTLISKGILTLSPFWSFESNRELRKWDRIVQLDTSFNIRLEPNSAAGVGYSILNLLFVYPFSSKWIHSNLVVKNCCFEPASIIIFLKSLLFILQLQAVSNGSMNTIIISMSRLRLPLLLMKIFSCYLFLQVLSFTEKHKQPGVVVFRFSFYLIRSVGDFRKWALTIL